MESRKVSHLDPHLQVHQLKPSKDANKAFWRRPRRVVAKRNQQLTSTTSLAALLLVAAQHVILGHVEVICH